MLSRLRHSDAALVNAAKDILSNKPYCSPSLSCSKRIERSLIYSGGETAGLFPSLSRYQEAERLSCLLISGSFSIFFFLCRSYKSPPRTQHTAGIRESLLPVQICCFQFFLFLPILLMQTRIHERSMRRMPSGG